MATLKIPIMKNDHIRGPVNAPITLVEYGDYECPHCALAYPIVNQVQSFFRERMRFVFRHFPLTEIHPHAEIAAELGLPETALRHVLETGQFRNKVRNDFVGGVRSGVNGTPTFFINGVRHDGPYDCASLVAGIQMRAAADART